MNITVEISHYPLKNDYEEDVLQFIAAIKKNNNKLEVYTNSMSTYIKGDVDHVMEVVKKAIKHLYVYNKKSATILKVIPGDLPVEQGFLSF